MSSTNPCVSIIMATYNRSNVLRYAVASVLRSTVQDWELIVVGDACTDDTEAVIAGFSDPRIRFYNLERNIGEQSGPNNRGLELARGRFIAFLNHDDLWWPDHLEIAVNNLESSQVDLVFTMGLIVGRDGPSLLCGATDTGYYEPSVSIPASLWVFRRELMESVGPWRFYRECFNVPSQDWLFRARRADKSLVAVPRLTAILIQSGSRAGSYAHREEDEHRAYYQLLVSQPDLREIELTEAAARLVGEQSNLQLRPVAKRLIRNVIHRASLQFGISPRGLMHFFRYGRRGAFIDRLRAQRGLPKLERNNGG